VKSVSFYLEWFQRYGVLKDVQLFGPLYNCYTALIAECSFAMNDHVCLWVCLFTSISLKLYIQSFLALAMSQSSFGGVDTLCTSSFVDAVTFSHKMGSIQRHQWANTPVVC